jgi:hypothetical protein
MSNTIDVSVNSANNVLKNALAGVKQSKTELNKIQSLESLRAGTSRQIAMAYHFAENAVLGKFPISTTPKEIEEPNYFQLSKQFSFAKNQFNLWQDFLDFNLALDATRNQSLLEVVPEFKLYV